MKYRKPLLWLGYLSGVIVLLTVATALFIGTRSDEWWRDQLGAALTRVLDREVEIQGHFHLVLGRRLIAEANSVRIGNPEEWTTGEDMLHLGSLLLEFDLLSVLGKTLLVHQLELKDLELALEENQFGQKNWEFAGTGEAAHPPDADEPLSLPVHFEKLSIQRAGLTITQPGRQRPLRFTVNSINAGQQANDDVVIEGTGRLGDLPVSLQGRFGKLSSVLAAGSVSYQLSGELGKSRLFSKGSIDSLEPPFQPTLEVEFTGPDFARIMQAIEMPKLAAGPFEILVELDSGGRGVNASLKGKFEPLQINAEVSTADIASADNLDVNMRVSGKNLNTFTELFALPPLPKGAYQVVAELNRNQGRTRIDKMIARVDKHELMVSGVLGRWNDFSSIRLDVSAEGPSLVEFTPIFNLIGLRQLPTGAYRSTALLTPGVNGIRIRSGKISVGDYRVTAEGNVTTKEPFGAQLNVSGAGPDLAMISRLVDILPLPAWPFEARGRIEITSEDITLIGTSGRAGKHAVKADGSIAFSPAGPVQLDVQASGPSLQAVLQGINLDVIPASDKYKFHGRVEYANDRVFVAARKAQLGPGEVEATLDIPNINSPKSMMVDVKKFDTSDVAAILKLIGVRYELPQRMHMDFSGRYKRSKNEITLSNIHGTIGTTTAAIIENFENRAQPGKTQVDLDMKATELQRILSHSAYKAIPFEIGGRIAQQSNYTRFENLYAKFGELQARVIGKVGSWDTIAGSELSVTVDGPNLYPLESIIKRRLPEGAVKFDGHLWGSKDAFHIDRMQLKLGESDLNGDLSLERGKPPLLKGHVNSSLIDFAVFRKKPETTRKSESATTLEKESTLGRKSNAMSASALQSIGTPDKQGFLFPDTPIELQAWDHLDLDVIVRVEKLINLSDRGDLDSLSARILLKDRDLSISNFTGSGPTGSSAEGNLSIKQDGDLVRLDASIHGEQLHVGLAAAPDQDPATFPPADVGVKIVGAGSTYHQLAASLNGRIQVVQGEGRVNNSGIEFLFSDIFYQLFQALNPFSKTETTTRLSCAVYIVNLNDGIADVQDIVIQTDKLTIVSAGTIDLNTEQIELGFNTRPRTGLGISASVITNPFIRLGGTLTRPAIALDPGSATVATGAAVATGGLSLVFKGVWDRYFTARDPCAHALQRDQELRIKKESNTDKSKSE